MSENSFEHRGYQVKFQDWVGNQSDICLRSKWIARKPDMEAFLYVIMPFGASGVARTTQHQLDISLNNHWSCVPVDIFTSEEVKEQWKDTGRAQMLTLIDDFIDRKHEKVEDPAAELEQLKQQWYQYQQAQQQAASITYPTWTVTTGNTSPTPNSLANTYGSLINAYGSQLGSYPGLSKKGP